MQLHGSLTWQLRPIAQAISLEKFRGTDRSMKTAKLFHPERFGIYGMTRPEKWHIKFGLAFEVQLTVTFKVLELCLKNLKVMFINQLESK